MRNLLENFPTEKVKIKKKDSSIIDNVEAFIETTKIFIDDTSINIEEGDIIERILPSGAKEDFIVTDRGFHRGTLNTPDHYQIAFQRLSTYNASVRDHMVNQYNFSNVNKVNIQSTDSSTSFQFNSTDLSIMETMRVLAKGLENEAEILSAIEQMQNNIGKKSFVQKYNEFIQSISNHMTIFAPFIPKLASFLQNIIE